LDFFKRKSRSKPRFYFSRNEFFVRKKQTSGNFFFGFYPSFSCPTHSAEKNRNALRVRVKNKKNKSPLPFFEKQLTKSDFSFFTKKTCDTAILESKTKMSGNVGSHNQRFNAEAEEFSLEMIYEMAERFLKEKCGIFDNEEFAVPKQTLDVIENVKEKIGTAFNEAIETLQVGEGDRREQLQDKLFGKFCPVSSSNGIPRAWEQDEEERILHQRIPMWKQKLTRDPRVVEVDSERARNARVQRDTTFTGRIIMNAMAVINFVYVSLTSFTAPFVGNVVKQVFFNWGPWDDIHTQLWEAYQLTTTQKDNWYTAFPNSDFAKKGSDGSPSTTRALFDWINKMFLPTKVNISMENVCPYSLYEEWAREERADGKKPPHRTPDFFKEIARDTFFRWLSAPEKSKTDSVMMVASNTIEAFIEEVTSERWREKYLLLRLDNSAYTILSSRDEILRADLDFTINVANPHVFGIYMLCDLDEATGEKDIFIEAIPAPSGMVKVVPEESRGQSYRRIVSIAEASNNMRRRWARTGWITEAAKGLIALNTKFLEEDSTSPETPTPAMDFMDSENNNGNGGAYGSGSRNNNGNGGPFGSSQAQRRAS